MSEGKGLCIKSIAFVILAFFLPIISFLFVPVKVELNYRRRGGADNLILNLTLLWLIRLRLADLSLQEKLVEQARSFLERGFGKAPEHSEPHKDERAGLRKKILGAMRSAALGMKHECLLFHLFIRFNTGDAAATAILSGMSWATGGPLLAIAQNHLIFRKRPSIRIIPVFDQPVFDVTFHCIVKINPGYIIVRGLHEFQKIYRARKKRRRVASHGGASDRRPHEDGHAEYQRDG